MFFIITFVKLSGHIINNKNIDNIEFKYNMISVVQQPTFENRRKSISCGSRVAIDQQTFAYDALLKQTMAVVSC